MPRNDPSDTGGLFVGRRPGTAPLKYRAAPTRSGSGRQRVDGLLAHLVLLVQIVLCVSAWGPQPLGAMWIGSQITYRAGSLFFGIVCAFLILLASVFLTLALTTRIDGLWRILRRAAGHDQTDGVLARVWMWTALIAGGAFLFWFIVINGPGSSAFSGQ